MQLHAASHLQTSGQLDIALYHPISRDRAVALDDNAAVFTQMQGRIRLTVRLEYQGTELPVSLTI